MIELPSASNDSSYGLPTSSLTDFVILDLSHASIFVGLWNRKGKL